MYVVPPRTQSSNSAAEATDDPHLPGMEREQHTVFNLTIGLSTVQIFCLQGRLIFGPDARSLGLTILLVVAPVAVFCVFVARKLMDDFSHHLGILVMVVVVVFTLYDLVILLMTSGRDPGIIPRNAYPPEPEIYDGSGKFGGDQTPQSRLPRIKNVVVNGVAVKIKYCDTCKLYRPPRCSHCSICNNCVERFDHHCPWVGQCIGLRNYRFYFMFVSSTTLLCVYVFGFCWVYVRRIMDGEGISIWKAMTKTPASIVLIIYTFISFWFVGGLTALHLYLIGTNQSTYENFRYRYDRQTNPYNKGVFKNFKEILCTSIPQSKNKFRAKVPNEHDILPHMVSSGFASPTMGKTMADIEMGRKTPWDDVAAVDEGELKGHLSNDNHLDKDVVFSGISSPQDLSRSFSTRDAELRYSQQHQRHSSWGRSGREGISNEALAVVSSDGHSNRISSVSSGNFVEKQQ